MTNKEWLATLSATDFYMEFKRAEEIGKRYTSTSGYVIQWLGEIHKEEGQNNERRRIYIFR